MVFQQCTVNSTFQPLIKLSPTFNIIIALTFKKLWKPYRRVSVYVPCRKEIDCKQRWRHELESISKGKHINCM